jgi:hypothetical protein
MLARTSVGGLLLEEAEGWTFTVQDGVISGKFREESGVLRIGTIPSNRLAQPVTHEACLSHAAELAGVANPTPSHWKTSQSITGPYGSAHFDRGSDRVYVWYCCRSPGVIVGAYACPADMARTYSNRGLIIQCNCMISSAIFDRRIWGADDEITRLLSALMGGDDAQDGVR